MAEVMSADTSKLIAFAQDAEVSAQGPIPVVVRLDDTFYDVAIVGKKGQTFQLVAVPREGHESSVRDYLAEKAADPREWLRRRPRVTHPVILQSVREALAAGSFYNDDVERHVNERVGNLPPHQRHGEDRDALVEQLAHEVYIARGILQDERFAALEQALLADGYRRLDRAKVEHGKRYTVRRGTVFVGHEVSSYGEPIHVRGHRNGDVLLFIPKGGRTHGFALAPPALIREGWTG